MRSFKITFIVLAVLFALAAALAFYLRAEKEASIYESPPVSVQQIGLLQHELGMDRPILLRYWLAVGLGILALVSAGVVITPQPSAPQPPEPGPKREP